MKNVWFIFILLLFLIPSLVSVIGCTESAQETATPPPKLSEQQVISIIQVYGVPHFEILGAHGSPVGHWAAVCEGNVWRVQGAVVLRYEGKDYYFSTTWQYSNDVLELVNSEGVMPEGALPTETRRPIKMTIRRAE